MKKIKSIVLGVLLIVSILAIINPVSAATLEVGPGKTHATINNALANANDGDTILVYPGTYNENVLVNRKNLTLKSVAGRDSTTIGPGIGDNRNCVISIGAGMGLITIDGFSVILPPGVLQENYPTGIGQSILSTPGDTCHIFNNKIITTGHLRNGIQVTGENSKVIGNIITGGPLTEDDESCGILIISAETKKNIIARDNHILGGMDYGIGVATWGSGEVLDTIVENNIIEKTVWAGITIGGKVSNTLVKDNIIKNNPIGLENVIRMNMAKMNQLQLAQKYGTISSAITERT